MRLLPVKASHTSLGQALVLPETDLSLLHLSLVGEARLFSSIATLLARTKMGQKQSCPQGWGFPALAPQTHASGKQEWKPELLRGKAWPLTKSEGVWCPVEEHPFPFSG